MVYNLLPLIICFLIKIKTDFFKVKSPNALVTARIPSTLPTNILPFYSIYSILSFSVLSDALCSKAKRYPLFLSKINPDESPILAILKSNILALNHYFINNL